MQVTENRDTKINENIETELHIQMSKFKPK